MCQVPTSPMLVKGRDSTALEGWGSVAIAEEPRGNPCTLD
jgi:hypothetical protein